MAAKIGFDLTMRVTERFMDRAAIARLVKKGMAGPLSKIGAFLRRRARSSLRRRKRVSQPGEPPSVHSDSSIATLKNILFAVDEQRSAVLCGPVKLNQVQRVVDIGTQTVPQIMEFGGTVRIHEESRADGQPWRNGVMWRRRDLRRGTKTWKRYRVRSASFEPRPFMGPALEAEVQAGTIPRTLSGTVRV